MTDTTAYNSISEVMQNWYNGNTDKFNTYHTIPFFWLSRIGSLLQFFAGLTIIAEIIGKEKLDEYAVKIDKVIDLQKIFRVTQWKYKYQTYERQFQPPYVKLIRSRMTEFAKYLPLLPRKYLFSYKSALEPWIGTHDYNMFRQFNKVVKKNYLLSYILYFSLSGGAYYFTTKFEKLIDSLAIEGPLRLFIFFARMLAIFAAAFVTKNYIFPLISLVFSFLNFILLAIVEIIFIVPFIFYLKISKKEKTLKSISFSLVILGFLLNFIFS